MPKTSFYFLFAFALFTFLKSPSQSYAQADQISFKKSYENKKYIDLNYFYEVELYQIQNKYHLSKKKGFNGIVQMLYGKTMYSPGRSFSVVEEGYEGGVVLGFLFAEPFFSRLFNFYFLLGAGPYYISHGPKRQTPGLLFSDNVGFGVEFCLFPKLCFVGEINFRHLSNAGFKKPNSGLNNFLINIGLNFR